MTTINRVHSINKVHSLQSKIMYPTLGAKPVPLQSTSLPMTVAPTQIGIDLDLSSLMNLMITMMIVVMMMKMMTGAMGTVSN